MRSHSSGPTTSSRRRSVTFLRAVADLVAVAADRFRLASTVAERSEWFERLAHTDPLTGLANMRTFSRVLELELARAGRQGTEVSVAVFDIDDLTATNDAAGHEAGDDVLRSVAAVVAGAVRLVDSVARARRRRIHRRRPGVSRDRPLPAASSKASRSCLSPPDGGSAYRPASPASQSTERTPNFDRRIRPGRPQRAPAPRAGLAEATAG